MKNLDLPTTGKQFGIDLPGKLPGSSRAENNNEVAGSTHQFSELMNTVENQASDRSRESHESRYGNEEPINKENIEPAPHASVLDYLEAEPGEDFIPETASLNPATSSSQVIDFNEFITRKQLSEKDQGSPQDVLALTDAIEGSTTGKDVPVNTPGTQQSLTVQQLESLPKNGPAVFPSSMSETGTKFPSGHDLNPGLNNQEKHTNPLSFSDRSIASNSALDTLGQSTNGEVLPLTGKLLPASAVEPVLPGQQPARTLFPEAQAMLITDIQSPLHETRQATTQASTVPVLQSNSPFGTGAWMEEFSGQIRWLGQTGIKHAEISLNPAELGSIEIRILSTDDQATVKFITASNATREIIENSLPRLREMLASFGLDLGDTSVAHEEPSYQQDARQGQNIDPDTLENHESSTEQDPASPGVTVNMAQEDGLINIYI